MKKYQSILNLLDTQIAIKLVKDTFERKLAKNLRLIRVSAPLFVNPATGLNDHLTGREKPISFTAGSIEYPLEIVQSLAKWKRNALQEYNLKNLGIYTDMNAIRPSETLDNIHSLYVDQWDWEIGIKEEERNLSFLKKIVGKIYRALLATENVLAKKYPQLAPNLPPSLKFITSEELLRLYPKLNPKEREHEFVKRNKACFIMQIGWPLSDNTPHDDRAADYDDWNLNGDLLLWYEPLDCALELSSMGIRVGKSALIRQLTQKKEEYKLNLPYGRDVLAGRLPYTIGGGIGQSRMCMYMLKKIHIGEVQASVWPDDMASAASQNNIKLL